MARICTNCKNPLSEGDVFCPKCGQRVQEEPVPVPDPPQKFVCPQCGTQLKGTEKYCKHCGLPVAALFRGEKAKPDRDTREQARNTQNQDYTVQKERRKQQPSRPYATSGSSFYIIDFAKNIIRSGNIPSLIYIVLNVFVITAVIASGIPPEQGPLAAVGWGLLIYLISITIALSPIGEMLLRYQSGCQKIRNPQVLQRIQPLFNKVHSEAKRMNPSLPDKIGLYMDDQEYPNAFATGRRTVCISKGLLAMPDPYIEAVLGHEFGHLCHHDTDMLLLIIVGNMFINFFVLIGRVVINFILIITSMFIETEFGVLMHRFVSFLCALSINLMLRLWTGLGVLLTMKTSRKNEYEADHFSGELGHGRDLADALEYLDSLGGGHPQGVFAALSASHPPTKERIARLRADF